jgi:hypothetical protein
VHGNGHAPFWSSGRRSDPPIDCNTIFWPGLEGHGHHELLETSVDESERPALAEATVWNGLAVTTPVRTAILLGTGITAFRPRFSGR